MTEAYYVFPEGSAVDVAQNTIWTASGKSRVFTSIQAAIDAAADDKSATIIVAPGTYTKPVKVGA